MKPLLLLLTVVGLFVAGAAGTYFLMPVVAPEKVLQARHDLDSLNALLKGDTLALAAADTPAPPAPADTAAADTTAGPAPAPAPDSARAAVAAAAVAASEPAPAAPPDADQAGQARELAAVMSKMEDKELRALVASLDGDVLRLLYREASSRNKTRLLQAIPPERAGEFVRGLIVPVGQR